MPSILLGSLVAFTLISNCDSHWQWWDLFAGKDYLLGDAVFQAAAAMAMAAFLSHHFDMTLCFRQRTEWKAGNEFVISFTATFTRLYFGSIESFSATVQVCLLSEN